MKLENLTRLLAPLRARYAALPERDRRAVLLLGGFLAPALLYFLLIFPVQRAHQRMQTELEGKQVELAWMQESVARFSALRGQSSGQGRKGRSLSQLISDSAPQHQLQISRLQPRDNSELQVWLEEAKFQDLLRWLHQTESDFGLSVVSMNLTVSKNPGFVKVQLKFRG